MSSTINNLNEFKSMATLTYDNRSVASKNWSKTWGMGWWMDLWHYKEYSIGCLKYRTGKVYFRHHSENVTKFYVDDKEVSRKEFFHVCIISCGLHFGNLDHRFFSSLTIHPRSSPRHLAST